MGNQDVKLTNAEVALLGLLSEKPKHPWQIEKDVECRGMRSWTDLSTSGIYKRLQALERAGLAVSDSEIVDGRARKVYAATDAGREALAAKLLHMLEEPEGVKWGIDLATYNFDLVPRAQALDALRGYRAKLVENTGWFKELEEYMRSDCPGFRAAVARRPQLLLEGEIRWVDEFIAEMGEAAE